MVKRVVGIISFMNAAGGQEAILRLMRQLRARGYETEVWFLYEQVPCYANEPFVHTFRRKPHLSVFAYIAVFFALLMRLRRTRPDAVVGFLPLGNVMGLTAAALAGVKIRIASQRSPGTTFGAAMRLLDWVCGATGIYQSIVCVSESVRRSFARHPRVYRKKLSVVNNGIEWKPSSLSKTEARASFNLPADLPLAVATGRFTEQKNYELMVRAVAETPGIRLAIAGDGRLRPDTERLAAALCASGRIHFLGNLNKSRVYDLLRAGDIFVQTSLYEGQSNSTLEAMNQGLPIVCSDIPMQRETLCAEDWDPAALLVPLDDIEAWRRALKRLRDDPDFAARLGDNAKAMVNARFALSRMTDGFENVIVQPRVEKHDIQVAHAAPSKA